MSTITPLPVASPAPAIRTRAQLDALLENIAELHREREAAWHAQETDIAAVRARYRAQLTELQHLLELETGWAETWARAHRGELDADGTLATDHGTLSLRAEAPRLERASRRWTWSRIAATLPTLPWGARYLRTPEPVVDQEAILADLGKLSREELRAAGMDVVEGERFFLTPHAQESAAPPAETMWREAA